MCKKGSYLHCKITINQYMEKYSHNFFSDAQKDAGSLVSRHAKDLHT